MTVETAEMLMKQFPRRSGQSNDTVICLAMASNSAGGTEARRSAPASVGLSGSMVETGPRRRLEVDLLDAWMPSASCVDPQ